MAKFTVYYEEGGHYSAKVSLEIEAKTKEEALQKVRDMPSIEGLTYNYEPQDNEVF